MDNILLDKRRARRVAAGLYEKEKEFVNVLFI